MKKILWIIAGLILIIIVIILPFKIFHGTVPSDSLLAYWSEIIGVLASSGIATLVMFYTIRNEHKERENEKREIVIPDNFVVDDYHQFKNFKQDIDQEISKFKLPLYNLGNSSVYNLVYQYQINNLSDLLPNKESNKENILESNKIFSCLLTEKIINKELIQTVFPNKMSFSKYIDIEGDTVLFVANILDSKESLDTWDYIDNFKERTDISTILKSQDKIFLEIPEEISKTIYYALRFASEWKASITCRLFYTNYKQEKYRLEFEFLVSTNRSLKEKNFPLKGLLQNLKVPIEDITIPLYLLIKTSTIHIQKVTEYENLLS